MTQNSMTETLHWPQGARLAVCLVVDQCAESRCASGSRPDRRSERLLELLAERELPASVIGADERPDEKSGRIHHLQSEPVATASNALLVASQPSSVDSALPEFHLLVDDCAEPRWMDDQGRQRLLIPLDPSCSDRQMLAPSWWTPDEWLQYVMDSFDCLHLEAEKSSILLGLHLSPQGVGRSGAAQALGQLLGYIQQRESVWIANAQEIARHCQQLRAAAEGTSA